MAANSASAQNDPDFLLILLVTTAVIFVFVAFIVTVLFLYQRRYFTHQRAISQLKQDFQKEILKTQLEIQEETFKDISEELHDNVGQVLSFVKLSLNSFSFSNEEEKLRKVNECRDLIGNVITDVRDLSKSLSNDFIAKQGLKEMMNTETDRLKKSGLIAAVFDVEGEDFPIDNQHEVILFRIFQESLNNTLKHAKAKAINIHLKYTADLLNLTIEDDGIGFDPETKNLGSGLTNIKNRAALIGAKTHIISSINNGCSINVMLDRKEQINFS